MNTSAIVDIAVSDNATVQDAFKFGTDGDTTWSFTGMTFKMEVKASRDDTAPLVTWTSGAGQIVVDDAVNRVLHLNVPDTDVQASLPPAEYVYDFIMLDGSTPAIRTQLMQGKFVVCRGVTED